MIIAVAFVGLVVFQLWQYYAPGNWGMSFNDIPGEKIVSPEKTKFVQIVTDSFDSQKSVQVLLFFGYPKSPGGGGVFAAQIPVGKITALWQNDHHLKIIYPENSLVLKRDTSIQFLKKFVKISYDSTNQSR